MLRRSRGASWSQPIGGLIVVCLALIVNSDVTAQTGVQAEGLRLSTHDCFASANDTTRLDCRAEDFAFPQTWRIEGRMVRLVTRNNQVRYLRRGDVRNTTLHDNVAPMPLPEEAPGAVIRAEIATPVHSNCSVPGGIVPLEPFSQLEFADPIAGGPKTDADDKPASSCL